MGDSDDFPYKVILHDIPGISKQKLRNRLQELTNTTKIGLTYITRSSAKVSFDNIESKILVLTMCVSTFAPKVNILLQPWTDLLRPD